MTGFHFGVFLMDLGHVFIVIGLIFFLITLAAYLWVLHEEKK